MYRYEGLSNRGQPTSLLSFATVVLMGEKSMNMSKGVVEAGDGGRKVSSMSG